MSSINIESEKNSDFSKKDSSIDGPKSLISKKESENVSDASFSFSKPEDIDSLYENMSQKSKDDINLVFESSLQNATDDLNQEIDFQFQEMARKEQGFDDNIKLISSNFYKSLVDSLSTGKQNQINGDKTKIGVTKYGSSIDDLTMKLKSDLSGVPFMIGDVTNMDISVKKKVGENDNDLILKDSKLSKEESSSTNKNKLDYKKTMSLEYSKEKESYNYKKDVISYSSQNKPSVEKGESKSSKNNLIEDQK